MVGNKNISNISLEKQKNNHLLKVDNKRILMSMGKIVPHSENKTNVLLTEMDHDHQLEITWF